MISLNDFYNDGSGWICRQCERDLRPETLPETGLPRYYREGEAESKMPAMSTPALAKWLDRTRQVLICPRCGLTEPVDKQ